MKPEEPSPMVMQGAHGPFSPFGLKPEPPVPILKIVAFSLAVTLGATGLLLAISWLLSLVIH